METSLFRRSRWPKAVEPEKSEIYIPVFCQTLIKYSHSLQNSYLLSQTSRRFLLAAGFRLNQIVSWFLSAMILYFPRSLRSLPRKLHQQRRTIHHAKIDERKKPFLLNSSCYGQLTPQASVGKRAQYQPNKLAVSFPWNQKPTSIWRQCCFKCHATTPSLNLNAFRQNLTKGAWI